MHHAKRITIINKNLQFIFNFYFKHNIAKILDIRKLNKTKKFKKIQ